MNFKSLLSAALVFFASVACGQQNRAYVTTTSSGVQVINIDDAELVQTIDINGTRLGLIEDLNLIAISSPGVGVVFVDYISNEIVGTTSLPSPAGLADIDSYGGGFFLALDSAANSVNFISLNTFNNSFAVPFGITPDSIVIQRESDFGELAYITLANGTVIQLAVKPFGILAIIPVGSDPGELAILPNETEVYVANRGDGTVSVINTTSAMATNTITIGATPLSIAAGEDDATVYVGTDTVGVLVIDTGTKTITGTIPNTGANNGVAVTLNGEFLAVASETIEPPFSQAGLGIVPTTSTTTESAVFFSDPLSVVTFDFPFVKLSLKGESGVERTLSQDNLFNRLTWTVPELEVEYNAIVVLKDGEEIARLTRLEREYTDENLQMGVTNTYTVEVQFDGIAVSSAEVTLTTAS